MTIKIVVSMGGIKQKLVIATMILTLSSSCMSIRHANHSSSNEKVDPVCGQVVSGDSLTTEFRGVAYYFDSEECRSVFLKDPERFVGKKSTSSNHFMHWGILGGSVMAISMVVMMLLL